MQCFCFICDGPASECQHWGSGESCWTTIPAKLQNMLIYQQAVIWAVPGLLEPTFARRAGLGSDDHCRAYPSNVYRRKRDSYKRKQSAPTPAASQQPFSGTLNSAQAPAARQQPSLVNPGAQAPCPLLPQHARLSSRGKAFLKPGRPARPTYSATLDTVTKPPVKSPSTMSKDLKMHMQLSSPRLDKDLMAVGSITLPVKVRTNAVLSALPDNTLCMIASSFQSGGHDGLPI